MAPASESERTVGRDEAATVFRAVADGDTAGALLFGADEEAADVDVPDRVSVEVDLETEYGERSVEVEMEWP